MLPVALAVALFAVIAHAASLGSGPTTVSLSGSTTSQGSAVSGGSSSGTIPAVCGPAIAGTWQANIFQDAVGYNIQYIIDNSGGAASIDLFQVTDYSNDGTVDTDYRTDLGGTGNPGSATRDSTNKYILFNYSATGGATIPAGDTGEIVFVNAESTTYSTSGGEIVLWATGSVQPCNVTTSAAYPHN